VIRNQTIQRHTLKELIPINVVWIVTAQETTMICTRDQYTKVFRR